ncbi:gpi-anchor transamidase-like protein [Chaetomium sp. MPI-CAGE-AT-0009]|nr:gpi-anchor transamidase-like protein [Chaetomium sp. MPI-CAGE-AT-0009]
MKLSGLLGLPALLAATLLAPAALVGAEHTSNWAVLVCTSRFWFNYRHLANVLSMYRTVKRLGIPDSQIILMLPDDMACNPRNAFPGTVYSNADRAVDLYGDNIEVDYRGYEVTVENFIRLLTDRVGEEMPRSKRLLTDDRSNILVYMTGHGGNEFLKFQDAEEIGAFDLADAFEQMWEKKRYNEILFMIDTCQANTMYSKLYSPNIIATGSSELDQSSYSHHADNDIGVAVIDRYTYYNLEFLETEVRDTSSKKTVGDLFDSYTYEKIHSHAGVRYDLFRGGADAARKRLVTDFFGNVQNVEIDAAKNTTALDEDILSLSRTIAALHRKAEEEEAALKKNVSGEAETTPVKQKQVQFAKPLTDENWWAKKMLGAAAVAGCTFLPLREITVNSRPLVKRAIQFSCDGDLAVTADDSVHVFVPEFPDLSRRRERLKARVNGQQYGVDDTSSDEEEDENGGPRNYNHQALRAQYSEGSKHMPVSFPPLDPRVNRELFMAQDIRFPYEGAGDADAVDVDSNEDSAASDGAYDSEEEDDQGTGLGSNRPYGAGYGPITGVGSSMNHVVGIGWSPSGLGVNRRPILAVLTGSGTLTMFGDGSEFANILPRANEGMLQRRELNSWVVLWGVGERLIVPGQQTEISEYLRGFAWAREVAPGQALLATINDLNEVAIISVQCVFVTDDTNSKGDFSFQTEPRENVVWLVREIARFKAEGPHKTTNPLDPDYVPFGTSFGLRWGPWLQTRESRTCALSFIDRGYVGFRRITIKEPWIRGELPSLEVGSDDIHGMCVHLSVDAFVEFEDAIWTEGPVSSCRGLIATGFDLKQFEVKLLGGPSHQTEKHSVWDCGTVYRENAEHASQNPIADLVIHPPNLADPTPTPLYTLIRLSATATTHDWYQTNVPASDDPAADPRPQWVRTIAQKLEVRVPVDMHLTRNYDDSGSEGSGSGSEDEDDELDMDGDLDSLADEEDIVDSAQATVLEIPEIHPHRYRLHGLTLSPGGGVAAVLASNHSTQRPERGGWHTVRSNVLFGHKPRRQHQTTQAPQPDYGLPIDPQVMNMKTNNPTPTANTTHYNHLTTEAKLFENLYGGGPEVPGVHYHPTNTNTNTDTNTTTASSPSNATDRLRALFAPALATQKCDLCGAAMDRRRGGLSGCRHGHFFGTCATSGLAVQTPGATRSCGACGLRTMRAEVLVAKMPEPGRRDEVRRLVGEGVCGACGGKFLS